MADDAGIENPPYVEPIRSVTPTEAQFYFDGGMREQRWKTNPGEEGEFDIAAEQEQAFLLSQYVCTAKYPLREEFLQPLDDEQWAMLYDHWVSQTLPCFESYGLTVQDNVPSRDVFLKNPTNWHPSQSVTDSQIDQIVAEGRAESIDDFFINVCPGPDENVLYGVEP